MEITLFNEYARLIKKMMNDDSKWMNNAKDSLTKALLSIDDKGCFEKAIIDIGLIVFESIKEELQEEVVDYYQIIRKAKEKNYSDNNSLCLTYSAYRFVSCVFLKAMDILAEDVDIDSIDDNEFYKFSDKLEELSKSSVDYNLLNYSNKLLDYSRTNQLVNFRNAKLSSLVFENSSINYVVSRLLEGKQISIGSWKDLSLRQVHKCKLCGKYKVTKYNEASSSLSIKCEECDDKNRHKRLSYAPLLEKLKFSSGFDYVCNCGKTYSLEEIDKSKITVCCNCNKDIELTNSPYIKLSDYNKLSKDVLYNNVNDKQTFDCLKNLAKKAKDLESHFGLHALYLAVGFLNWQDYNNTSYNSPILLIRIHLITDKVSGKSQISSDMGSEVRPIVNQTLKHMLESNSKHLASVSGESITLPNYLDDYSPIDYLKEIEYIIKKSPNLGSSFSVSTNMAIGFFHYQKLQLAEDLKVNYQIYKEHPIISRLCNNNIETALEDVDCSKYSYDDFTILDMDSSQQEVIEATRKGSSFVLQGPPGTGKSQTITNIIADAISCGKSVLFVTEKANARSIITENLSNAFVGDGYSLNDFVLNFDNTKSKRVSKESIVKSINETISKKELVNPNYQLAISDYKFNYEIIDSFLHEMYDLYDGESFYFLVNQMIPYTSYKLLNYFNESNINNSIPKLLSTVSIYYGYKDLVRFKYKKDPLFGLKGNLDKEFIRLVEDCLNTISIIEVNYSRITSNINVPKSLMPLTNKTLNKENSREDTLFDNLNVLSKVCKSIIYLRKMNEIYPFIKSLDKKYLYNLSSYLNKRYNEIEKNNANPLKNMGDYYNVYNIVSIFSKRNIISELSQYDNKLLKRLSRSYRDLKSDILSCFKKEQKHISFVRLKTLANSLVDYYNYYNESLRLNELYKEDSNYIHSFARNINTDWPFLIEYVNSLLSIVNSEHSYILNCFKEDVKELFNEINIDNTYQYIDSINEFYNNSVLKLQDNLIKLSSYYDNVKTINKDKNIKVLKEELTKLYDNSDRLNTWNSFYSYLSSIRDNGVITLIDSLIENNINDFAICEKSIYHSYYKEYIRIFIKNHHLYKIDNLNHNVHEMLLNSYKNADEKMLSIAPSILYSKLSNSMKEAGLYYKSSYQGKYSSNGLPLLINKRGYSLKELIKEYYPYLIKVKPCFMMSPLNVSQYLDISLSFDLVIFDEASQIFVEDSLASIVRGKQIIISGDDKQLPPCDFFKTRSDSLDSIESVVLFEEEEELTSVLDVSIKLLGDITRSLKWHYRSSDESLIAFSNSHFYDGNLITFPRASLDKNDGIVLEHVAYDSSTCYVSGKGKVHKNVGEIKRIVELLYEEITSVERCNNSIGVVAFSNAQASEIEKAWEDFKSSDKKIALNVSLFEEKHPFEPIIFCNLDTMQGDERDTILISTCYGFDDSMKFNLSFLGPIRLSNGKKRINVAITRAKHRMIVVTSMDSSMLYNAITSSKGEEVNKEGSYTLYEFLKYTEEVSLNNEQNNNLRSDNKLTKLVPSIYSSIYILEVIKQKLLDNNICFDMIIGKSECKVDFGIKRKEDDESYVAGVIVDYPREDLNSVKEYARLTTYVLEKRYNWNIIRFYIAGWYKDQDAELNTLIDNIKKYLV